MKRVLSVLTGCALLWSTGEASVTDVKWGVDAQNNLRLVVDLTEPADFVTSVENQTLVIRVKSALDGDSRTVDVASDFAKTMHIKAAGADTVVRVPLSRMVSKEDIKTFTLKQDQVTKRPSRIVFDILKKAPVPAVASSAVKTEAVLREPKITVGSGSASTQGTSATRTNPNVNPKLIPASVVNSKGVQLSDTKQIAKIPEIRKTQAPVNPDNSTVVGNSPMANGPQPSVKVRMKPGPAGAGVSVGTDTSVQSDAPEIATAQTPKITVGSSPTNVEEMRARNTQRGKDAVADILGRSKGASGTVAPAAPTSGKRTTVVVTPTVTDSVLPATSWNSRTKNVVKTNKKSEYRTGGGIKGKIITIDPGHGGSDPGAVSNKGTYEKTITLSMAQKLKSDLEKMGAIVYMTRNRDMDVGGKNADDEQELQARVDVAEKRSSDLFISLHINASVNKKASGISTYYYAKTQHDGRLAKCIHKQLTTNFGLTDMGVREANFYVTKRCYMPAVLMELGFITNAKEEKTIKGNWFQNKAMDLVAKGIRDYFK